MAGKCEARIAVVTGGSRGIGRAIAEALLAEGASVAICGRSEEKGKTALDEMGAGDRGHFVACDVRQQDEVEGFIDAAAAHFGSLDILVNNAGGSDGFARVHELTDRAWQNALAWNLNSTFWATRRALPHMLRDGRGRIITISSIEGKQANKSAISHYITNKHAINGFVKAVACEYGPDGITSNAICPGAIETDTMRDAGAVAAAAAGISYEEFLARYAQESMIKRLNTAEEVAAMAVLLASDAGAGITGALLNVDGGERAVVSAAARAYIDGRWVTGEGEPFEVINPATEEVLAVVPGLTVAQADEAVAAAGRAFAGGPWSTVPARERSRLLHRLADLLERDTDKLIELMVEEIGTPRAVASFMQVPFPVRNFRWFADAAAALAAGPDQTLPTTAAGDGTATLLTREPIGVVLGLTAFNFPLNLAAWKIGGALAAGCSIVLMCSPKSVLTTTALAALIEEAGFPPGAFNFVYGPPAVAEHLCAHPGIDFVTFTGSAEVGRRIVELSAPTLKRVVLELGGKSADVLLPGSDVRSLALRCVLGWTGNAGQGCSSLTRTLVHRPDYEQYLEAAVTAAEALGCGDPRDANTVVGPLVSAAQRSRVAGYVDRAVSAGAKVLTGGKPPQAFPRGYFYEPTVVVGVDNSAEIAQDELFGPVSVVLPYDDVDEAVTLANDTIYGLAANVWGPTAAAVAVAGQIRAGTVTVNGGGPMLGDHPWGGYKQSGLGREGGVLGFAEFFETKHILWPLDQPDLENQ